MSDCGKVWNSDDRRYFEKKDAFKSLIADPILPTYEDAHAVGRIKKIEDKIEEVLKEIKEIKETLKVINIFTLPGPSVPYVPYISPYPYQPPYYTWTRYPLITTDPNNKELK